MRDTPRPSRATVGRRSLPATFWILWSAGAVSAAGDGIYAGALPLLTASVTRDPQTVAWTTTFGRLGWLALGLLAGVLVDRWSKTRVMWQVDALRAVAVAVFGALVWAGHTEIAAIYAVALLLGLLGPFFDTAESAVLPSIVGPANLERANSWTESSRLFGATLIGPPLGALLFAWQHSVPLLLEAASFGFAAVAVAYLRTRVAAPPVAASAEPRALRVELREGIRYLARHRLLRTLCLLLAAINAITGVVLSLLALYSLEVLKLPPAAYGWLITTFAVGGLCGTAVVPWLRRRLGTLWCVTVAAAGFGIGTLLFGVAPQLPFVAAGIVLTGIGSALWNVVTVSLRQRLVPAELLGRVTGAYRMVGVGALPVGAAIGGAVAHATDVRTAYAVAGMFMLAALVAALVPLRAALATVTAGDAAAGEPVETRR